jgi:hypothetical protein
MWRRSIYSRRSVLLYNIGSSSSYDATTAWTIAILYMHRSTIARLRKRPQFSEFGMVLRTLVFLMYGMVIVVWVFAQYTPLVEC